MMRLELIRSVINMENLNRFLRKSQSVAVNTKDEEGHPFSSYASFYYDGEVVYISVPSIVTHVKNLEVNPKASLLFVEEKASDRTAQERHRTTLECDVSRVDSESLQYKEIMSNFEEGAFGILMGTSTLILYALTPTSGEITFGFDDTYVVTGEKMNEVNLWKG